MPTTKIIRYPDVELDNSTLPVLQSYAARFGALAVLDAWWDLTDASKMTLASGKLASISASAGSGVLAQSTDARRPTRTGGEIVFSAAASTVLAYGGTFPSGDHAVAVIVRHSGAASTQNIAGVSTPTDQRHVLFNQPSNALRYTVNTAYADVPWPAGSPATGLVIADYRFSDGVCRIAVNDTTQTASGGAGAASLSTSCYFGAASVGGGSSFDGTILDAFLFHGRVIGTAAELALRDYARQIRGIDLAS